MNEYALARALHVLGVVLWIGGVAFVTLVLLPAVQGFKDEREQVAFFEQVESRFAWQARLTTLLTGLSGFWMVWRYEMWGRFAEPAFWWMHAMVFVWLLFTLMLFVFEPLFLHRRFIESARSNPSGTFKLIQRLHWLLLALSLITVFGAVAGSHGAFFG